MVLGKREIVCELSTPTLLGFTLAGLVVQLIKLSTRPLGPIFCSDDAIWEFLHSRHFATTHTLALAFDHHCGGQLIAMYMKSSSTPAMSAS